MLSGLKNQPLCLDLDERGGHQTKRCPQDWGDWRAEHRAPWLKAETHRRKTSRGLVPGQQTWAAVEELLAAPGRQRWGPERWGPERWEGPLFCKIYLQELNLGLTVTIGEKSPGASGGGGTRKHFEIHQIPVFFCTGPALRGKYVMGAYPTGEVAEPHPGHPLLPKGRERPLWRSQFKGAWSPKWRQ